MKAWDDDEDQEVATQDDDGHVQWLIGGLCPHLVLSLDSPSASVQWPVSGNHPDFPF